MAPLFRALLDRGILEIIPRTEEGSRLRVNVELQDDFSMGQVLALYVLETIPLLDPESGTRALDLLTFVESIIETSTSALRARSAHCGPLVDSGDTRDDLRCQRIARV